MPHTPVRTICEKCHSPDVTRDAWAEWDVGAQDWVLRVAYDYSYCHACEADTHIAAVALA